MQINACQLAFANLLVVVDLRVAACRGGGAAPGARGLGNAGASMQAAALPCSRGALLLGHVVQLRWSFSSREPLVQQITACRHTVRSAEDCSTWPQHSRPSVGHFTFKRSSTPRSPLTAPRQCCPRGWGSGRAACSRARLAQVRVTARPRPSSDSAAAPPPLPPGTWVWCNPVPTALQARLPVSVGSTIIRRSKEMNARPSGA